MAEGGWGGGGGGEGVRGGGGGAGERGWLLCNIKDVVTFHQF